MKGATYRQVLDEVQPHYEIAGLIVAAIAAGVSAYSSSQQAKARNRAKRGGMNAEQLAKGGVDSSVPTAHKFVEEAGGGGARLGDMLGKPGTNGISQMATPKEQGFSLGTQIQKLGDEGIPSSQSFEPGLKQSMQQVQDPVVEQPKVESQSGAQTAGQIGGYAETALQLYQMYQQMNKGPDPQKAAPVGPMNLQPSALRYGQRQI